MNLNYDTVKRCILNQASYNKVKEDALENAQNIINNSTNIDKQKLTQIIYAVNILIRKNCTDMGKGIDLNKLSAQLKGAQIKEEDAQKLAQNIVTLAYHKNDWFDAQNKIPRRLKLLLEYIDDRTSNNETGTTTSSQGLEPLNKKDISKLFQSIKKLDDPKSEVQQNETEASEHYNSIEMIIKDIVFNEKLLFNNEGSNNFAKLYPQEEFNKINLELQAEKTKNEQNIKNIENKDININNLTANISQLENSVKSLNDQITTLNYELNNVQSAKRLVDQQLNANKEAYQKENSDLQAQIDDLTSVAQNLNEEITELKSQLNQAEQDKQAVEKSIESYEKINQALHDQIKNLEDKTQQQSKSKNTEPNLKLQNPEVNNLVKLAKNKTEFQDLIDNLNNRILPNNLGNNNQQISNNNDDKENTIPVENNNTKLIQKKLSLIDNLTNLFNKSKTIDTAK